MKLKKYECVKYLQLIKEINNPNLLLKVVNNEYNNKIIRNYIKYIQFKKNIYLMKKKEILD